MTTLRRIFCYAVLCPIAVMIVLVAYGINQLFYTKERKFIPAMLGGIVEIADEHARGWQ